MAEEKRSLKETKTFFEMERMAWKVAGMSLQKENGTAYKIYSYICIFMLCSFPTVLFIDLCMQSFNGALESWMTLSGYLLVSSLILTNFYYRVEVGALLNKLEEKPFLPNFERGGHMEESLIQTWYQYKHLQGIMFFMAFAVAVLSQFIYSLLTRITNSDPHDWKLGFGTITVVNITYSPNFEIFWVYEYASVFFSGVPSLTSTLMVSGVLNYIATQFKMLQNKINMFNHIEDYALESVSNISEEKEKTWVLLKKAIKEVVDYHNSIFQIIIEWETIFEKPLLAFFIATISYICIEILRASLLPADDIRIVRILVETLTGSFHMIVICYSAENMAHESKEVAKAAYNIDFVGMDLRIQKCLIFIIGRSQNPRRLKAGKLIDVSIITAAWICRTSYSAYMVLKTVNAKNN